MKFYDKIDYIRDAQQDERLVIFVGAGVSKNSNIPNWYQLIKAFSKELPYAKCNNCKAIDNCKEYKCEFATDEFLKIPQYYWRKYGSDKYYKFLKSILHKECRPNSINEIIMDLQPKHIITTNYDRLIEDTEHVNRMLYKVVRKDEDLLKFQSSNYIIKMHGDIYEDDSIVLKEEDYLKYSSEHRLIETMIKSLFLNHTFLFIGYSLNDYNLKLIISWVNEISKQYEISKERCKHFIVDMKNHEEYEIEYYEESGIYVINNNDITPDIIAKYSKDIDLEDVGKKLYSVLNMIGDYDKKYEELKEESLYRTLQIFKDRRYIAICELRSVYSKYISLEEVISRTLIIRKENEYNILIKILSTKNEKVDYILDVFYRSGIDKIRLVHPGENKEFSIYDKVAFDYELLELVQQNKFEEVYNEVIKNDDNLKKAYYLHLCNPYDKKIDEILDNIRGIVIEDSDYFKLLSFKLNEKIRKIIFFSSSKNESKDFENIWRNIPNTQKKYFKYIKDINDNSINYKLYSKDIKNLEKNYRKEVSTGYYIGGSLYPLLKIQAFAYEYYYYIKFNHIMIDYFSNSKDLFDIYIKSMLCTYIPSSNKITNNNTFRIGVKLLKYKLNKIDLDIIIKYIDTKVLKEYFEKYSISEIVFEDNINNDYIIRCFENLCVSLNSRFNEYFVEYIKNYLRLFTKCNLDNISIEKVIKSITCIIDKHKYLYEKLEDEIILFLNYYKDYNIKNINDFIDIILDKDIFKEIDKHRINKILKIISKNANYENIQDKVLKIIKDSENMVICIYKLYPIISKKNLETFKDELINDITIREYDIILYLVVDGVIEYNNLVEDKYIELINKEIKNKKTNTGIYTFPDKLEVLLEHTILLHLLKFDVKIERFFDFSEYSIYIEFIKLKENFDYKKIHKLNYMWLNLFRIDYYRNLLITYGKKSIEYNLSTAIDEGYATEDEKKVYYKYFDKEF